MRQHQRQPFDASGPFVARSAFNFNGQRIDMGEPFPHIEIDLRCLRNLYNARKITMAPAFGFEAELEAQVKKLQAAEPHVVRSETIDWRLMDPAGILKHCLDKTGHRRRNVDKAIADLTVWEASNGGAAHRANS